ncbi:hypothetical protein HSX37_17115|uniref:Lysophospholipase L1 n=1 Tax=Dendrosporobacter quercicolus TaxID=146817 RepID=A0A1G9KGA5_9FIRM|nr:GDSL-type esterase/lipase family protein [Dendrosporobacter quercicolus]NSL49748.1 hypothetical protein [Dendrosporobacter quercicolus DSM 1736]SDL48649.1 Lysophospholipase L1 [Dendrosporobacter quercicolus]
MGAKIKIAAIGDSITYGYPFGPAFSWLNSIGNHGRRAVANRGVCGDTTSGMLKRFAADVLAVKPHYTFILGGTNDACSKAAASLVENNIVKMTELAVNEGIKPVIGIPVPSLSPVEEEILHTYRLRMYEYARTAGICYVDFYAAFQAYAARNAWQNLYVDELHPSQTGYRLMGETASGFFGRLTPEVD